MFVILKPSLNRNTIYLSCTISLETITNFVSRDQKYNPFPNGYTKNGSLVFPVVVAGKARAPMESSHVQSFIMVYRILMIYMYCAE